MMSFLTAVVTSRYPTTNNQLRTSSNPRQQATIYDGKVTVQPVQGRHTSYAAGTTRKYTSGASGSNTGKPQTVLFVTNAKERVILQSSTLSLSEKGWTWSTQIVCCSSSAGWTSFNKEEIAFLQIQTPDVQKTQTFITHNAA
ncbi:hypothetical protein Tco_1028619 [Tanacetum coccineum]|uniref:Uncharacterized protein n=1 Tax=Tanacetum coccineum TaxID=301880 RepID=A0ABQ5G2C4_9ASTR